MFTYVVLMKLTGQGMKTIKESPARAQMNVERMKQAGAKVHGIWYTQGEYDLVSVVEWPTEEAGTAFSLALAAAGNVTIQTLRAFTIDEMAKIVKAMP